MLLPPVGYGFVIIHEWNFVRYIWCTVRIALYFPYCLRYCPGLIPILRLNTFIK